MALTIKVWDKKKLILHKKIEMPYKFTNHTPTVGIINYHLNHCTYCGEPFIGRKQGAKHCSNKCLTYNKRIRAKLKKLEEKILTDKIRKELNQMRKKELENELEFLRKQKPKVKK